MSVIDLDARRRVAKRVPPTREPDFMVKGWIENNELDWSLYQFADEVPDNQKLEALIDVAWMHACHEPDGRGPAFWWFLNNSGQHIYLHPRAMQKGTSWRHALWFARQWWRLSIKCAGIAWRLARGG